MSLGGVVLAVLGDFGFVEVDAARHALAGAVAQVPGDGRGGEQVADTLDDHTGAPRRL